MQTPVEDGQVQGVDCAHVVVAIILAVGTHLVPDRLCYAVEGESDSYTC